MQIMVDIPEKYIEDCNGHLDCIISIVNGDVEDVYSDELGLTYFEHKIISNYHERVINHPVDYKGCKNCVNQIEPLRMCKWAEQGGDGCLHLICPRWERRIIKDADSD